MIEEQQAIKKCVTEALSSFNASERYLILRDLSERCICAKLMSYLEKAIAASKFSDYVVDVEYNRGSRGNQYAIKKLRGRNIVVDLIVHKRGYSIENDSDNNLICIEMKKAYKRPDMTADMDRLRLMTDCQYGFGYKAGFMIVAVADERSDKYELQIASTYYNQDKKKCLEQ